jgi:alpha-galactosidase
MGNSQSTPAQMPPPLKILKARPTPHNFTAPPRGWNSFGLQINPAINPAFTFDQSHVIQQAERLVEIVPPVLLEKHDYYISLDSGWSIGDHGDEHGRTIYDSEKFDIPSLAALLHSRGLKLGVYVLPGAFEKDGEKNILGTDIRVSQTWSGNNNGFARCDFDFKKPGVQEWHNSVVALFADW